ncbi:MAG: glycosyltransferase family 4 protein [Pricia sp.]
MPKKTVLFIGFTWPEPASTAAGHRISQLLDYFQNQKYRTVFASTAAKTAKSMELEGYGIEEVSIKLNDSGFDTFVKDLNPQIVVFDRFLTEEQFGWRVAEFVPDALRILDTEDLHSLRKTREMLVKQNIALLDAKHPNTDVEKTGTIHLAKNNSSNFKPMFPTEFDLRDDSMDYESPVVSAWLQNDLTKREMASIYRCDLSLIISSYEMELLGTILKIDSRLLLHLPFMLDALDADTIQQWPSLEDRKDFVCIGNGKHAPNVDAILWLKKKIWPLIQKQLPEVHLNIYGAYLPEHILQMNSPREHFHVLGWVENVKDVLRKARVNLAPLRFGAGIKGKLVDAMQTGTPSITTSIGAEGMHSGLPWGGAIENTAEEFAKAAVRLYQNPKVWRASQENGIAIINSLYNKDSLSSKLSQSISEIENNLSKHRRRNFIGAMLMHHSMMGTKYMAKWISAKNNMG